MKVPQLTQCCCGCSLRLGTIIIGWINLISSAFLFLLSVGILLISLTKEESQSASAEVEPWNPAEHNPPNPFPKYEINPMVFVVLSGFLILISLLFITLSTLLLLGVYKNKPKWVVGWVATVTVIETLRFISFITGLVFIGTNTIMISEIVSFVINIYLILVVYSYYREVRNAPNAGFGPV